MTLFSDDEVPTETLNWLPDRQAGLARLSAFLPRAGRTYAQSRNYDLGADDRSNVSALSPWLRHRLITETEVLSAVVSRHGYNGAEKFIQEIFWRGYFKGWLQHRPQVWRQYREDLDHLVSLLSSDHSLHDRYNRAINGQTGIDAFDHWAKELVESGYLHNHARMWVASIWIFTLKLPWQLGADFFAKHLLDWDPASNTLSWRWVGGLHTVGKTYLARPDNIAKYTKGRFHPIGQLAMDAPALSEPHEAEIRELPPRPSAPNGNKSGLLLLTEEDVSVDPGLIESSDIKGVIGLTSTSGRSAFSVPENTIDFAKSAVASGVSQVLKTLGDLPSKVTADQNWGDVLSDFAHTCGTSQIFAAEIPIGPSSDAMANAATKLKAANIHVHLLRRSYDQAVWPYSKKGFFGLKKRLPIILSEIGITH